MKNIKICCVFTLVFLISACSNGKIQNSSNEKTVLSEENSKDTLNQITKKNISDFEEKSDSKKSELAKSDSKFENNLVDILELDKTILVDLKYASSDNFMKKRLYFDIDKLYLQKDVAERLVKVQAFLKEIRPDLTLLLYDGVRPLSVQTAMWNALDSIPVGERTKFVSNPANGSIHNYGAAIDLTLAINKGVPLDMGAGYDDIRKIAYPSMEEQFLKLGELTKAQVENRKLLRKVMSSQGFMNIATEWWHFNACSRNQAKIRYQILE